MDVVLLLPLMAAVIGFLLSWIFFKLVMIFTKSSLYRRYVNNLEGRFKSGMLTVFNEELEDESCLLKTELDGFADRVLDEYFVKVKQDIPMSRMVLNSNLSGKLKKLAKDEFYNALPYLNDKAVDILEPLFIRKLKAKEFLINLFCGVFGFLVGCCCAVVISIIGA